MTTSSSTAVSKKIFPLAIGGGLVFWATTVAISLLPIAAEYRAAFSTRSWSAQTVWVDSLIVGMIFGGCVSYFLLRFFDRLPTRNPILKSATLGFIALVIAIILIDVPHSFLFLAPGDAWRYFLIGIMLNTPRFLFLGIAVGYLYRRLYEAAGLRSEPAGAPSG
jgi:hypothetical protein